MADSRNTFIIGDVHGCLDQLLLLLKLAKYNSSFHRLILLGDLINKGPHSFQILSWVREQQMDVILGNHELKFIRGVETNTPLPPVLEKLKQQMGTSLPSWLNWIKSWPTYIEEKNFLAVHGGLIPGEHPRQSKVEILVNLRYWNVKTNNMQNIDPIIKNHHSSSKTKQKNNVNIKDSQHNTFANCVAWHDLYTDSKLVVYAHWARQGLKIKKNSIGLDTGCVYGGPLTGLWLPERKIVQTPNRQIT